MTRRTSIAVLALGLTPVWPAPRLDAQVSSPIRNEAGEEIVATFSIVARDPATSELGVAVQSRAFRAGAVVSYAKAGVGAIATQAAANQTYGPRRAGTPGAGTLAGRGGRTPDRVGSGA